MMEIARLLTSDTIIVRNLIILHKKNSRMQLREKALQAIEPI
jgi:hypothetical protein